MVLVVSMNRDTTTRNNSEFYNSLHWDNIYVCNNNTVHDVYRETINTRKRNDNINMNTYMYSTCNIYTNNIPEVDDK